MSFYDKYVQTLEKNYPQTAKQSRVRDLLSENLICPHVVTLPKTIADQAKEVVSAFFELRQSSKYQNAVAGSAAHLAEHLFFAGNYSALMCFDFHWTEEQKLKLIEINTNASVGLIGDLLYKTHGFKDEFTSDFKTDVVATFREEFSSVLPGQKKVHAAIIDQKPEAQKLFLEFHLYKEIFESNGIECEIVDSQDLVWNASGKELFLKNGKPVNLVYNRDTDFYLDQLPSVKNAWLAKAAAVSPNPNEYALLADKQRLEELSKFEDLASTFDISKNAAKAISNTLLKTFSVSELGDRAWSERKNYFFKPKRSFGGKAVYKGASISRGMFEKQVLTNEYVAQELATPSQISLEINGKKEDFKFDLRFYVYKDKIQAAVARVYQGQTTNMQTPGGGIAALTWK